MRRLDIDPHNDELGKRVQAATAFLRRIRRSGTVLEPEHFPRGRRFP